MRVPLSYGPKEKFLSRVLEDPDLTKPVAIVLPRISFELVNMVYNPERKLNKAGRIYTRPNSNTLSSVYNPVPYDLFFSLYIMVKNAIDATRIVEQILPYFTPNWTARLTVIPEMNIEHDIPIVLTSTNFTDTYTGDFTQRRVIIWQLNFTMLGYLYGPVENSGQIKQIYINFRIPTTNTAAEGVNITPIDENIYIQPGLTIAGQPTTNAAISIPPADINENDNWGYIVEFMGEK